MLRQAFTAGVIVFVGSGMVSVADSTIPPQAGPTPMLNLSVPEPNAATPPLQSPPGPIPLPSVTPDSPLPPMPMPPIKEATPTLAKPEGVASPKQNPPMIPPLPESSAAQPPLPPVNNEKAESTSKPTPDLQSQPTQLPFGYPSQNSAVTPTPVDSHAVPAQSFPSSESQYHPAYSGDYYSAPQWNSFAAPLNSGVPSTGPYPGQYYQGQYQVDGAFYGPPQHAATPYAQRPAVQPMSDPSLIGGEHARYPYYSYRRPWYSPGPVSRNVNIIW
ncbi:hypothetical protein SH668x_002178 [Planctomicrobium sp. SH668]|uniref:hypothetical protein n=1 Tax=Planctomicrobium sp. SH668 TaxID=3448126 RepID=UPI003F5C2BFC